MRKTSYNMLKGLSRVLDIGGGCPPLRLAVLEASDADLLASDWATVGADIAGAIQDSLRSLTREERLVLILIYIEGLTWQEVGTVLDISEEEVCRLRSQALERISRDLQREKVARVG